MNFQIETTSFCNLTCPECPNWTMERERKMMSLEVFQTILKKYVVPFKDRNRHCPPTVIMHKDGEPWLNKRLPEMLKMVSAADPTLSIDIYTHGLQMKREHFDLFYSLPNPKRLLMSFHFWNHDGTQNDYTATTQLVKDMLNYQSQHGKRIEIILVSHMIRPMTKRQLQDWKRTWDGYESRGAVTVHANVNINPWTGLIEEPGITSFESCPYGDFGHWFFGATGNVIACCLDLEEEIVFGNVMQDDPEAMFKKLTQFYADVSSKKLDNQVCRYCLGVEKRPVATASAGVQV